VRNLLQNAAEHAAPARCVVAGDARSLTIEDDGPGIAESDLPHVFERAWRGPRVDRGGSAAADDAAGASDRGPSRPAQADRGLGLAIARQLAELNGWTLEA